MADYRAERQPRARVLRAAKLSALFLPSGLKAQQILMETNVTACVA